MPEITSVLGNEPGIQYDRPNDKTGGTGTAPINNVIVGIFKRGHTDKLMNITKQNIRAILGYQPENPFYVAVQDALDTNVPSVKVARIVDSGTCAAGGFSVNPNNFPLKPNGTYHIDYRINNGSIQRYTYPHISAQPNINFVYEILNDLINSISLSNPSLIVGGGGGTGYFQKLGYGGIEAAELEDVGIKDPQNITFYSVAGQVNDPILAFFGVPQITIHSCGMKNWDGY